jgi:predicted dehydrogenase
VVLGKTHKKLEHPEAGNIWGDDGVSTTPLEEAACAMIVMKNGATIMLETSWALSISDPVPEGSCVLCGTKAGISLKGKKLVVNKVDMNRMMDTTVDTSVGGVAFYDGNSTTPADLEARQWIEAVVNDTAPCVLPQQAYVVSQILEAIYESSKTGKPVFFE